MTLPCRKPKSTLHVALLGAWALTLIWFNPRLFRLYAETESVLGKAFVSLFIASLDIFWFFGWYYLMLFLFTFLSRRSTVVPSIEHAGRPRVAVLYLTMNDFQPEAAASCVSQEYPNYHVFILDDSTQEDKRREVDRFHETLRGVVTVIRRKDRRGFKAGNINHALRHWVTDYPYFAVVDSDEILPNDFISRLMPYLCFDDQLAFVQGSHRPNPRPKSNFARDLCLRITSFWTTYFGPRNDYGFVPFLGHGGIIRRDVWKRIGGFPEVVAEDLAFSTKARELGYRGHFVGDVISYEDFPETYAQFRRQQEKYIKGGCEYIATYLPSFVRSRGIPWFEKLDVMISCGSLFLPVLHVVFILTFGLVLIYALGELRPLVLTLAGSELKLWDIYVLRHGFEVIWESDFYWITVLNIFAPVLGCVNLMARKPARVFRLLFLSAVPYLSLMIVCTLAVFTYFLTRRADFLVTGDTSEDGCLHSVAAGGQECLWVQRLNSGHPLTHLIELSTGVILSFLCLKTMNLALFAVSVSLVLGYFLLRFGWDHKFLAPFLFLPFGLIVGSMALLGMNLMGTQGILLLFFALHF